MYPWEAYQFRLYVERPEFSRLLNWIDDGSVSKQVTSLVAAPSNGKTWFLLAVRDKLRGVQNSNAPYSPKRLVIFCNAPVLINHDQSAGAALNLDGVTKWLEQDVIIESKHFCPTVTSIILDRGREPAAIVTDIVNALAAHKLPHTIVVLVDGLDELSDAQALLVESQILEPFIRTPNIRMIIAHRDEHKLRNSTLRRNNGDQTRLRLEPLPLPSVQEQFQKFKDAFHPSATHLTNTNLQELCKSLEFYRWDHPFINNFLFDTALKRTGVAIAQILTSKDLDDCLRAVIQRPKDANKPRFELHPQMIDALKAIAEKLSDDWTLTDLVNLGYQDRDPITQQLFSAGIAFYNPQSRRYQLADGIRELVRDLIKKESEGKA